MKKSIQSVLLASALLSVPVISQAQEGPSRPDPTELLKQSLEDLKLKVQIKQELDKLNAAKEIEDKRNKVVVDGVVMPGTLLAYQSARESATIFAKAIAKKINTSSENEKKRPVILISAAKFEQLSTYNADVKQIDLWRQGLEKLKKSSEELLTQIKKDLGESATPSFLPGGAASSLVPGVESVTSLAQAFNNFSEQLGGDVSIKGVTVHPQEQAFKAALATTLVGNGISVKDTEFYLPPQSSIQFINDKLEKLESTRRETKTAIATIASTEMLKKLEEAIKVGGDKKPVFEAHLTAVKSIITQHNNLLATIDLRVGNGPDAQANIRRLMLASGIAEEVEGKAYLLVPQTYYYGANNIVRKRFARSTKEYYDGGSYTGFLLFQDNNLVLADEAPVILNEYRGQALSRKLTK